MLFGFLNVNDFHDCQRRLAVKIIVKYRNSEVLLYEAPFYFERNWSLFYPSAFSSNAKNFKTMIVLIVTSGPLHILQIELAIISHNCLLPYIKRVKGSSLFWEVFSKYSYSCVSTFFYPLKVWSITAKWLRITCLLYLLGGLENENLCLRIFSAKMLFFVKVQAYTKPNYYFYIYYICILEIQSCSPLPCCTGNCTKWVLCNHCYLVRNAIFFSS